MPTYAAYGLTVQSTIPFPELPLQPADGAPDVEIEEGTLGRPWLGGRADRYVEAVAGGTLVMYRNGVQVLIRDGRSMTVDAADEEDAWVRQCVLGPAFALLLQQRGGVVLHGSAVRVGDLAVVFVGVKGEGKSTTAATLVQRGHDLLTDDVAAGNAA